MKPFVSIGGALMFVAVALGAFGAHALKARVSPDGLETWRTAAQYQSVHALALILTGLILAQNPSKLIRTAGWLFVAGIAFFSGSLYVLVLTDQKKILGPITPLGGLCFLSGWLLLAIGASKTA